MDKPIRAVIVSGGRAGPWISTRIQAGDFIIGADRGALSLMKSGYELDAAIGDFDSVSVQEKAMIQAQSRYFMECDPVYKDLTDTEMALRYAMDQGAEHIMLLGVLGSRWDHSLANIQLLRIALERRVCCIIADEHNEIRLMDASSPLRLPQSPHTHVSLLPLTLEVSGVTLTGFKYPLHDALLQLGSTLGISNVLTADEGIITIRSGLLLVIRASDQPA